MCLLVCFEKNIIFDFVNVVVWAVLVLTRFVYYSAFQFT